MINFVPTRFIASDLSLVQPLARHFVGTRFIASALAPGQPFDRHRASAKHCPYRRIVLHQDKSALAIQGTNADGK